MSYTSADAIFNLINTPKAKPESLRLYQLSEHFSWREVFTGRTELEISRVQLVHLLNAVKLAQVLEKIRADFGGAPLLITSWWRDEESNVRAGGRMASYHLKGMAADFNIHGFTPATVQRILKAGWPAKGGLGLGKTFTHIDIGPPRRPWTY